MDNESPEATSCEKPVTDKFEREFTEADLRASSSRQDECRTNMVRRLKLLLLSGSLRACLGDLYFQPLD